MKRNQSERAPLFITDAIICARQIVKGSLVQILAGTYQVPSIGEMISVLENGFRHSFDEFMTRRRIIRSHLNWNEGQVEAELEIQKRRFENELRVNLNVAAISTIQEVENLITSLNSAIKKWKIENL